MINALYSKNVKFTMKCYFINGYGIFRTILHRVVLKTLKGILRIGNMFYFFRKGTINRSIVTIRCKMPQNIWLSFRYVPSDMLSLFYEYVISQFLLLFRRQEKQILYEFYLIFSCCTWKTNKSILPQNFFFTIISSRFVYF